MNKRWMGVAVLVGLVLLSGVMLKSAVVQAHGPMTTMLSAAPAPDASILLDDKHGPPWPPIPPPQKTGKHGPPFPPVDPWKR